MLVLIPYMQIVVVVVEINVHGSLGKVLAWLTSSGRSSFANSSQSSRKAENSKGYSSCFAFRVATSPITQVPSFFLCVGYRLQCDADAYGLNVFLSPFTPLARNNTNNLDVPNCFHSVAITSLPRFGDHYCPPILALLNFLSRARH